MSSYGFGGPGLGAAPPQHMAQLGLLGVTGNDPNMTHSVLARGFPLKGYKGTDLASMQPTSQRFFIDSLAGGPLQAANNAMSNLVATVNLITISTLSVEERSIFLLAPLRIVDNPRVQINKLRFDEGWPEPAPEHMPLPVLITQGTSSTQTLYRIGIAVQMGNLYMTTPNAKFELDCALIQITQSYLLAAEYVAYRGAIQRADVLDWYHKGAMLNPGQAANTLGPIVALYKRRLDMFNCINVGGPYAAINIAEMANSVPSRGGARRDGVMLPFGTVDRLAAQFRGMPASQVGEQAFRDSFTKGGNRILSVGGLNIFESRQIPQLEAKTGSTEPLARVVAYGSYYKFPLTGDRRILVQDETDDSVKKFSAYDAATHGFVLVPKAGETAVKPGVNEKGAEADVKEAIATNITTLDDCDLYLVRPNIRCTTAAALIGAMGGKWATTCITKQQIDGSTTAEFENTKLATHCFLGLIEEDEENLMVVNDVRRMPNGFSAGCGTKTVKFNSTMPTPLKDLFTAPAGQGHKDMFFLAVHKTRGELADVFYPSATFGRGTVKQEGVSMTVGDYLGKQFTSLANARVLSTAEIISPAPLTRHANVIVPISRGPCAYRDEHGRLVADEGCSMEGREVFPGRLAASVNAVNSKNAFVQRAFSDKKAILETLEAHLPKAAGGAGPPPI